MKSLKSIVIALFTLVVMLVTFSHAAEGSSRVNSDIEAIQSEIQNAQRAFTRVRDSKGSNTREFDVAITHLRLRVNALNISLKSSKQASGATSKDLGDSISRLNAYFRLLEKARAQSDWRAVELDLGRLDASAKELHSAALKVPGARGNAPLTPPKPPATGPSGSPSVIVTPKPVPDSRPRTVGPYKPPLPVTRGPGPKGPDDPRFAVPPAPPVPPEDPPEPPPPDESRGSRAMPMEAPTGQGSPPMMRKPARPPVKLQDDFPKPKPVSTQNGTKPYTTAPHKRPMQVVPQTTAPPTATRLAQPPDSIQQKTPAARTTSEEKPDSPGYSRKPRTSLKTQNFLQELRSARSMAEVRKAYELGHFTDAELRDLQQQVEKSGYSKKLKQLVKLEKMTEPEKRKRNVATKAETDTLISARRHALERRQQQELKRLNKQAETTLRHLRSKTSHQLRAAPITGKVYKPVNRNAAANSRAVDLDARNESLPPKEEFGEILLIEGRFSSRLMGGGLYNEEGEVELTIVITGNYFSDIAGAVDFLPYFSDQRRLVPFSIDSWSEHQITGKILRQDIESVLGYGRHRGVIRVKRRGNRSGPKSAFGVHVPAPPPQITGVLTGEANIADHLITPGQTIIIMGEHFIETPADSEYLDYRNIVELQHSAPTGSVISTRLHINEFHNTWISAELGQIEGVPASDGTLKVIRSNDGEEATTDMSFQPTLSTWVFEERLERSCNGFFGWKDTVTLHDHSLANEWKVVNHDVRNGGYGGRGCNWLERPVEGSTETATRLEYWCDLFSTIFCTSEVTIEGPAGIHWQ